MSRPNFGPEAKKKKKKKKIEKLFKFDNKKVFEEA